jgi:predicted nucleic acid-binding protein
MISAVDTNVLLDVFLPDERHAGESARLLRQAYDEGALIICDAVFAELVPQFRDRSRLDQTLANLNVSLSPLGGDVDFLAGERWDRYRQAGGKRDRIITDFLIGAHAVIRAERFLTRDRGFYKCYFPELRIMSLK